MKRSNKTQSGKSGVQKVLEKLKVYFNKDIHVQMQFLAMALMMMVMTMYINPLVVKPPVMGVITEPLLNYPGPR